ncbi:MAG: hypothetical protein JNK85_25635 [Verrucomicrobiales bacterium]|nr:hypothetical protein [Verrucomicrobiales bacterium]
MSSKPTTAIRQHGPWGVSRRRFLSTSAGLSGALWAGCGSSGNSRGSGLRVAAFRANVTVPMGHGMMGGAWLSKSVTDPLEAIGWVLLGAGAPVVFVSVDWCEIRNDAYARWQTVLSEAAGTTPDRIMISTIHQHDAPVADLMAERLLRERGLTGTICDLAFHETAVRRVADALKRSIPEARAVSHVGRGQAKVERVASNRRYRMPTGEIRFDRTSATRNVFAIEGEEGLVDPWLRTLSFWEGDSPVVATSFYAVHPMSYYGQGEVSADFPGLARRARQTATPGVTQIYASGASGNLTAGKYNTGARENRPVLAGRIEAAMRSAWESTIRVPARAPAFRSVPLPLEPRSTEGFTEAALEKALGPETKPFQQCLAAMGLSWCRRCATGRPIEIPCLDFGQAALMVLPGESYVEYQLAAQSVRPDHFVVVAGYGDGATGYIPTDRHWEEHDTNLGDWCWVAPGAEGRLREAIGRALGQQTA